jgi:hypothetical protein
LNVTCWEFEGILWKLLSSIFNPINFTYRVEVHINSTSQYIHRQGH